MTHNYSFKSMVKKYVNSSAVLIICTVFALIFANTPLKDEFFSFWSQEVSLSIGEFNLFSHNGHPMKLIEVINDFLMAIFFLSVGLEIKREILVGELSSAKKAMLPIIGACGGMLIPVLFFWLTCPNNPDMMRGVAIPMAKSSSYLKFARSSVPRSEFRYLPTSQEKYIIVLSLIDAMAIALISSIGRLM